MSKPKLNEVAAASESGMFLTPAKESALQLRARATAEFEARARCAEELEAWTAEGSRKLVYELRINQIELELQNDELRRSQLQLWASRARYLDLYDAAPIGYLTLDEGGLVLEANLTVAGMLQVRSSSLLDRPWSQFIYPEDQDVFLRHQRKLASDGVHACELRLLHTDGNTFWASLDARRVSSPNGSSSYRTVVSDISERKRSEEELLRIEERHSALFESSPVALMTLAPPHWRFTSGNAATVAMFGARDEADFVTRTPLHYSPESQPNGLLSRDAMTAMMEVALARSAHTYEWTHRRESGQEFHATVSLARIVNHGLEQIQASVRDDSAEKQRRTDFAQAERLASIGMLAASVGHEINNPLAYVLSNVASLAETLPKVRSAVERCRPVFGDALNGGALGDEAPWLEPPVLREATEHARDALDGVQRITRIARVLNTFSRVETGFSKVDLVYALECAVTMALNEIRYRAKLIQDLAPVPLVWASEGKLSQVFVNLLFNASHAMSEGGVANNCLSIRTWAEGANVLAEIKDTGTGIAPANLERIFEPFFSTKAVGAGSGLGLAICRSLLTEFGGSIRVESQLGRGTSFLVSLPAWVDQGSCRPSAPSPAGAIEPLCGRILVVEDEGPLRRVIERLLADHEVVPAVSGAEAQAVLKTDQDFDVILCDLMMPELTGVELHRWLLERNAPLAKRMVFVTGGSSGRVDAEYLRSSGSIKVDKPFDNQTFIELVAARVSLARAGVPRAVRH